MAQKTTGKSGRRDVEPVYKYVGAQLRAARIARGITQKEAGKAVGIHGTAISLMEIGSRRVGVHVVTGLCEVYGIDVADVFSRAMDVYMKEKGEAGAAEVKAA